MNLARLGTRTSAQVRSAPPIKALIAALVAVIGITGLAACANSGEQQRSVQEQFGYMLPRPIVTMNAGTALGVATDAEKLSARLYPGAFIAGPNGQLLPNADLVTATPNPQDPRTINYAINAAAHYSDEAPVVCDDFQLTFLASRRSDLFASDMPLFAQVESLDCTPGARDFTVHFAQGFGARYRELFTPGTVLPSHAVAARAGIANLAQALTAQDEPALAAIGKAWQDLFNVNITDPSTVPTHGPYQVESRGQSGELELVANPHYSGETPAQSPVIIWPGGTDTHSLINNKQLVIADLGSVPDSEELGFTQPAFAIRNYESGRADTLRLDSLGLFNSVDKRRALNGCVDREAMVNRIGKDFNSHPTPTGLRMLPSTHPLASQLKDTSVAQMQMNKDRTREWLDGTRVRVGYLAAVPRYAAMVDELELSCGQAGVKIIGVPLQPGNYGQLGVNYDVILDTRPSFGRNAMTNVNGYSSVEEVKKVEAQLYQDMMTIPLITEPRTVAVEQHIAFVEDNGGDAGLSWNMDRWEQEDSPVTSTPQRSPEPAV